MFSQLDELELNNKENVKIILKVKELGYNIVKRLFDVLVGMIGMIFVIIVAIIYKIIAIITGDFKPIFYCQNRIGKNGKEFKLYKFRTMVYNADEVLKELLKQNKYKKEWKKLQKLSNDPRITKIGHVLRKTSLDELPQFINVLKGNMSLIGPRPLVKGELDAHNGNHNIYEAVRPGISGWWASHGRSGTTYEERLELEYFYVKNKSLLLDLKCIFCTIKAVIWKSGAK
ncbi:MAG: sugar transferase [Bacilli bacterium]|nr:sugar transferase [Bacilli bacterium]